MIFNRTQEDIDTAISVRKKLQDEIYYEWYDVLTQKEIEQLEKGTLTINTLNRIENKQAELKTKLADMGYYSEKILTKEWDYTEYFKLKDFERILLNLDLLRKAFFVYKDTPAMPENNYRKYQVINDVEKILYDLEKMADDVKSKYRQCGTFQCGEANLN